MLEINNVRFGKKEMILHPGEFFCCSEDLIISTILGSCIAVVLIDGVSGIGGMNHFMLPSDSRAEKRNLLYTESGRYGSYAMDLLINDMMKCGADMRRVQAKVFGGGYMFDYNEKNNARKNNIGLQNTQFAFQYLANEGIPVVASNTGDEIGRKIFYFVSTGKVLQRKIRSMATITKIKEEEAALLHNERKHRKITLFH